MTRITTVVTCTALLAVTNLLPAQEPNTLSKNEKLAGWKLLFDGKTTEGWRNYKKDSVSDGWKVVDGALVRAEDKAGDIITKEQYGSFELLIDFKISKAGNSGLMFHVTETEKTPWMTGPEVQVQDNVEGHDPQKAGWLYQLYQPGENPATGETYDATRPAGEWNQIYLRVTPDNCEIDMNGVRYATFKKGSKDWDQRVAKSKFSKYENFGKPTKGHIVLQDHNDEVAYRNIKIRSLDGENPVPNPTTGELSLKPELAFPKLKWAGWSPENEQGQLEAFRPIVVTYAPGDAKRLYVAEQHGSIWSFENRPDVTESQLVLDIRDQVEYNDRRNEEGLLGVAFHPQFKKNGYVFVYYTHQPGQISVISRFTVDHKTGKADPASETEILKLEQPFWNHNGGTIVFGPDGYLYVALGDGGSANDPYGNGQNLGTLLGSILRLDVDHPSEGRAYGIPKDNPFVKTADARGEIFVHGVRNPWRISFDRKTGKLWCADVGQNLWEEIDIVEAGDNCGWNRREGTHPFGSQGIDDDKVIAPLWEYDHQVGKSITGGTVYRGAQLPDLQGKYVYADYVTGKLWALGYDEAQETFVSNEAIPSDKMPVITFGEDAAGELFFCIVSPTGQGIYKLVSTK